MGNNKSSNGKTCENIEIISVVFFFGNQQQFIRSSIRLNQSFFVLIYSEILFCLNVTKMNDASNILIFEASMNIIQKKLLNSLLYYIFNLMVRNVLHIVQIVHNV